MAASSAASGSFVVSVVSTAHPTTARENRSRITATYAQPASVWTYVMSVTQRSLGRCASKSRASRFGATGCERSRTVVVHRRRGTGGVSPMPRSARSTRRLLAQTPCFRSSRSTRGLP